MNYSTYAQNIIYLVTEKLKILARIFFAKKILSINIFYNNLNPSAHEFSWSANPSLFFFAFLANDIAYLLYIAICALHNDLKLML